MDDVLTGAGDVCLHAGDSRHLTEIPDASVDFVITDPPYADAVQYAELADFFFVWLKVALGGEHPQLAPDESPKSAEIVQNARRGKSDADFHKGLTAVFREARRVLMPNGLLAFTFHHTDLRHWAKLGQSLRDAGFVLTASYPVASEGTRSGNLVFHSNRNSVAYDVIHVCAKAPAVEPAVSLPEAWDDMRTRILERVLGHTRQIVQRHEHGQRVGPADVRVMLWGECLAAYSASSSPTTIHGGRFLELQDALTELELDVADVVLRSTTLDTDDASAEVSAAQSADRLMPTR
jgi:adenine-specific DNA methylase